MPYQKCLECGRPARTKSGRDWCYWHDPDITDDEKRAARAKGGANSRKVRKLPPAMDLDAELDTAVVPSLKRIVAQAEALDPTAENIRATTQALATLDRAIARLADRGADVTRIEVVYVNDWRAN